jgi:hypothetical protein
MSQMSLAPPTVVMIPEGFQEFALVADPPPAIWTGVVNAVVQPDLSIKPANVAATMSAYGAHRLRQGTGTVTFRIDAAMFPASGGVFGANLQDADSALFAGWEYNRSTNSLRVYNQTNSNLHTWPIILTTGDSITIEIAGSVWRVSYSSASGTDSQTFTPSTGIKYPCFYGVAMSATMTPASFFPIPTLFGQWTSLGDPFWTVSGGTVQPEAGLAKAQFYAGVSNVGLDPGIYQIAATYADSVYQKAIGTITVQALQILGPANVALNPSQVVDFDTNYKTVSWSAIGGGSITQAGVYTAPSTPGTYTVRATYNTQHADVTVQIAATIQPAVTSAFPGQIIQFTTNMPSPVWSATCGTMTSGGLWTAPSAIGGSCTITMTSGATIVSLTVSILDIFPYDPSVSYTDDVTKTVLMSMAEDGSRTARVKNQYNKSRRKYELTFRNRDPAEYLAAEAFWRSHHPDRTFMFEDKILGIEVECYFDSDFRCEPQAGCPIDYSFRLIER